VKKRQRKISRATRKLVDWLHDIGAEAFTIDEEGEIITKDEQLARMMFRMALGWEEKDPDNPDRLVKHKPDKQMMMFIVERREGKSPMAKPDEAETATAAEKVSDLARARLNKLADSALSLSEQSEGVDMPDNGPEGPEDDD